MCKTSENGHEKQFFDPEDLNIFIKNRDFLTNTKILQLINKREVK